MRNEEKDENDVEYVENCAITTSYAATVQRRLGEECSEVMRSHDYTDALSYRIMDADPAAD